MAETLDYEGINTRHNTGYVHICGQISPPRWRPTITFVTVVLLLTFALLIAFPLIERHYDREFARRHAASIVGSLAPQDEVVHIEAQDSRDQNTFIELKLTAATFARLQAAALSRPPAVWDPDRSPPGVPQWWRVPRRALQVARPKGRATHTRYYFDASTRSVFIREWYRYEE